jgi:hypothetical protein
VSIPAHGAIVRGDDYHYAIALHRAAQVLTDPTYESVSVEDAGGGAFDDIVLRTTASSGQPDEYDQVKSGVYLEAVIDSDWLLNQRTERSKSPLQHFYGTWNDLTANAEPFMLRLTSNKNFDNTDPLLRNISGTTNRIPREILDKLGPRSAGGKQLKQWAKHLDINIDDLKDFLTAIYFVRAEAESSYRTRAGALLRNAGFRGDAHAVTLALEMVRTWVKEGTGVRYRADLQRELTERNLLAREGELVLAVHGIDRPTLAYAPNATVDILDLYQGDDPFTRRRLKDPAAWMAEVLPALKAAKKDLEAFGTKNVYIEGNMRLSMYFAVGRTFPGVGNWVLSSMQRGTLWSTAVEYEHADLHVLAESDLDLGPDLAVTVGLTYDPTTDVVTYIKQAGLPVGNHVTLSLPVGPGPTSVPGPQWAADWTRKARDHVRSMVKEHRAPRVHLFMSAPAGVALFLGHDWNQMPDTLLYDHVKDDEYVATMTFPG